MLTPLCSLSTFHLAPIRRVVPYGHLETWLAVPCAWLFGARCSESDNQLLPNNHQPETAMHLLICVVNNTASVNEIVGGFAQIGVTGATIIDSHGTAEIAAARVPVFAGFRQLVQGNRRPNRTIFSVINDDETLDRAMEVIERVIGDLGESATGIMFAIPVTRVKGLAPKMEEAPADAS